MNITLAQLERAAAPRLGPYAPRTQSTTVAATASVAYVDDLKTTTGIKDAEDLWLLRRSTAATSDRQRLIVDQDPATGGVTVDRPWAVLPVAGEALEFHHLDPALELRPAVLAGLKRCFFLRRVSVPISTAGPERDITASVAWITNPDQITRVQITYSGATMLPSNVQWSDLFEQSGHVYLSVDPDLYPSTLLITARQPHFNWVNAADSATGPTTDGDVLYVDADYSAAATHIEAWKLFPARMKTAADAGYQASQSEAATEFTRVAITQRRRQRSAWGLGAPFGGNRLTSLVGR